MTLFVDLLIILSIINLSKKNMNSKTVTRPIAPTIMRFIAILSFSFLVHISSVSGQTNGKILPDGYTRLPDGLEYKIITHGDGKKNPELSDHIELHISYAIGDSLLFDSRKMNNNKCVPVPIAKPRGPGDPVEVFMLMVTGDSAVARFPIDSIKKTGQAPPWAKDGDMIIYRIKLVSVKTNVEYNKEMAEKTAMQKGMDDQALQAYFKEHAIKANKTASGLYYSIAREGYGENIKPGQKIGVNYTGRFLGGRIFDSNTDSAFRHLKVLSIEVGKGKVIQGWDEGLQLLKTGAKATFYIPSSLAYGPQDRQGIPANSILVFDVEIMDIPDQAKTDDKTIKEYLTKNNIQAKKTSSGLYYVITQNGTGENAQPGKKVTMNYTGKTTNGNVFDSNTDPKFNHVQPFSFTLAMGMVIQGWDEGVQLLKPGSKATFFIPSGLAYGDKGAGAAIPPNTVLVFDVELVSIDN
jgi:FKBP-type peptidyl-prolyl cis-trans isomerase FkpA